MDRKIKTYKIIGKRIERARKARGLSQEQLGETLECSGAAISYFENGVRFISIYDLERIAKVLGLSTLELLQDHEPTSWDKELTDSFLSLHSETTHQRTTADKTTNSTNQLATEKSSGYSSGLDIQSTTISLLDSL